MHARPPKHYWLQVFCEAAKSVAWRKRTRVPHLFRADGRGKLGRVLEKIAIKERKQHPKYQKCLALNNEGACISS